MEPSHYLIIVTCILACVNIVLLVTIILKLNCGAIEKKQFVNERIIEGDVYNIKNYPFMAGLVDLPLTKPFLNASKLFCGSSIISTKWVISAEHCFRLYVEYYFLTEERVGVSSNSNKWEEGVLHRTDKWVRPDSDQYDFDVALLKVKEPFTGSYEKAIAIAKSSYSIGNTKTVTVLGWGYTHPEKEIPSEVLYGVKLKMYATKQCQDMYNALQQDPPTITTEMFCAGPSRVHEKKDTCNLDSGGPAVDGKKLIGLVSFGTATCGIGYPGVYVSLWKFEWWIHKMEKQQNEKIAKFD